MACDTRGMAKKRKHPRDPNLIVDLSTGAVANDSSNRPVSPKFETECALVTLLLEALGLPGVSSDPKKTYGRETGADVEVRLPARRIGVQVTEYHGDEGESGSALRALEESDSAKGIIRGYWVPADACGGLTKRFRDKLAKASRYAFKEFSEVWLLVAAFLPKPGAVAATSVMPIFITAEWLEQRFGEALRASKKYQRVFFHVHLWSALYEWSLDSGWRVVLEPEALTPNAADGQLWFKQYLAEPEIRRDPKGWAQREAQRVLQDLRRGVKSTPQEDGRRRGGYIMKTGKPRWSVGCIQNGPRHDTGLRWFVCERAPDGDLRAVAYTEKREQAQMIVASLEQTAGDGPNIAKL